MRTIVISNHTYNVYHKGVFYLGANGKILRLAALGFKHSLVGLLGKINILCFQIGGGEFLLEKAKSVSIMHCNATKSKCHSGQKLQYSRSRSNLTCMSQAIIFHFIGKYKTPEYPTLS